MNVGIISPIKYLQKCPPEFRLCYASLLRNSIYKEHFLVRENVLLLADSPSLPRRPALDRLKAGVKLLSPDYLILPSVDFSAEKTIKLVRNFLRSMKVRNPVGTLQGYDLNSLLVCYDFLKDNCDFIAVPSPLETIAKREEIVRDLGIKKQLLWLEVYKNPYEEVPPRGALGICTSFPFRVTQVNKRLSEYAERPSNPVVLDFFCDDLVEELADENIKQYLEVLK